MRFVPHAIRHVPEGGYTFEAFCVAPDCHEDSGAQDDAAAMDIWAMSHTARNPEHDLFRRVGTDHARVTRDE